MRLNYERALAFIMLAEGNHFHQVSGDRGGATSAYGIILATAKALKLDLDHDGDVDTDDLKLVTKEDVDRVFRKYFWDAVDADNLPGGIDLIATDIAWNSGPGKFRQFLGEGRATTIDDLTSRRKEFYRHLATKPGQAKFIKGWLNRANNAHVEALKCEV